MATWHWLLAGGAAAYLLLRKSSWAPASPQQQAYAATATEQQLTTELYDLVPEACKSAFSAAAYSIPTAGSIWLQGVLNDEKVYTDLATARADMQAVVNAVCANTAAVNDWGGSYGSSYKY